MRRPWQRHSFGYNGGIERWFPVMGNALTEPRAYGDGGAPYGYAAMVRDIADKRATEDALFNSERQCRVLVEGVRDYAIYILDTNGYITNWALMTTAPCARMAVNVISCSGMRIFEIKPPQKRTAVGSQAKCSRFGFNYGM